MEILNNPSRKDWDAILARPTQTIEDIQDTVQEIFKEVASKGDQAVKKYTTLFDGIGVNALKVSDQEIDNAASAVAQELKDAIALAKGNIERFHSAQQTQRISVETTAGVQCWQEKRPIQKVGLYIPGGSAPLFSTLLMLAIPAQIAGCRQIILCTPPAKDGSIHPAILYAASLCGVSAIYKVGGIQAIAAMTFGTESIPRIYKIFGPGNQFVTVAKQLATQHGVAIDMPAGPSELLVVADDTANAAFVASDLLSQAEHGADSQVVIVSTSMALLEATKLEIEKQLLALSRKQIASQAISNSRLIYLPDDQTALDLINQYGPEHFIVCVENEEFYIDGIVNAGSVFVGNYTPESAGDYASGTNHTLPTNGYAKQYSGVHLDSFNKQMTFQKISAAGIQNIGPAIEVMAAAEGLDGHKKAVSLRLKALAKKDKNK
ncbi:MAG: histidinol dehydrogenase [Dokdonia sp.]|jgi:histidinol dehydrogenase